MKIIRYQLAAGKAFPPCGASAPVEPILFSVSLPWSEQNEQLAQREAYRGEYTVEESEGESETATEEGSP